MPYSVGSFGGINVTQHLRQIFAELRSPPIPSSLQISKVHEAFSENRDLLYEEYNRRAKRFLDEFDWCLEAFKIQRDKCTPY